MFQMYSYLHGDMEIKGTESGAESFGFKTYKTLAFFWLYLQHVSLT